MACSPSVRHVSGNRQAERRSTDRNVLPFMLSSRRLASSITDHVSHHRFGRSLFISLVRGSSFNHVFWSQSPEIFWYCVRGMLWMHTHQPTVRERYECRSTFVAYMVMHPWGCLFFASSCPRCNAARRTRSRWTAVWISAVGAASVGGVVYATPRSSSRCRRRDSHRARGGNPEGRTRWTSVGVSAGRGIASKTDATR